MLVGRMRSTATRQFGALQGNNNGKMKKAELTNLESSTFQKGRRGSWLAEKPLAGQRRAARQNLTN